MVHGDLPTDGLGHGRRLVTPGRFASDDGAPDSAIRDACDHAELTRALGSGRVLVAVVARADELEYVDGIAMDKSSDMSVVSMVASDGRRGLLAFSGLDALLAWDATARPVPVSGPDAARAALDDGCEALVLDVAGPRTQIVPEVDLIALAQVDRLEYAHHLVLQALEDAFGAGCVDVSVVSDRLRLSSRTDRISARELAAAVPKRVIALVPEGIEVEGLEVVGLEVVGLEVVDVGTPD